MKRAMILLMAVSGCRLVPNYEVLSVPLDGTKTKAGSAWKGAPANVAVTRVHGYHAMKTDTPPWERELLIQQPFLCWLADELDTDEDVTLDYGTVTHTMVKDVASVPSNQAVLWETVSTDLIIFTVRPGVPVDATALSKKLTSLFGRPVEVRSHGRCQHSWSILSDAPFVVAIRVVDFVRETKEATAQINLAAEGDQEAPFGYRVRVVGKRLRISYAVEPEGFVAEHEMSTPWTSRVHEGAVDRLELAGTTLKVTRYTLRMQNVDSGLQTR